MSQVSCMRRTRVSIVLVGLYSLTALATSAWAQSSQRPDPLKASPEPSRDPEWTVEFRGGFAAQTNPSTGTGQLPLPNSRVETGFGAPAGRVVSSWLVGDGPVQWNGVFPNAPIQSIDGVLQSTAVHRPAGGTFGFTLGKRSADRWRTDLSVDVFVEPLTFTPAAKAGIEGARQSFASAFGSAFHIFNPLVTATTIGATGAGREVQLAVSEEYALRAHARFRPFITFGAGVVLDTRGPSATIDGASSFAVTLPNGSGLFEQHDVVTIHGNDGQFRWTGILGAGVDRTLTRHGGVRFAIQVGMTPTRLTTVLDTTSQTGPGAGGPPITFVLVNGDDGVIIADRAGLPSSLTGPKLTNFVTFGASGLRIQTLVSAGYYLRF